MEATYWLRAVWVNIKQSNVWITSCSQVVLIWGYLKPIDMLRTSNMANQASQNLQYMERKENDGQETVGKKEYN